MNYNDVILNSESIILLINHLNGSVDELNEDQNLFFERSKYHDDVRLILILKYVFEYQERMDSGKPIPNIQRLITSLENDEICNEIQGFEESFIKYLVKQDYSKYHKVFGNLSNSFIGLTSEFYNNAKTL